MSFRTPLAILLVALAGVADAQPPEANNNWFELQGAYVGNPQSSGLEKSHGLGLAGGQWVTPQFGWEASLLRDGVQQRAGTWDSNEVHLHGSALWDPLPDPQRWRPFLRLGVGVTGGTYEAGLATQGTIPGLGLTAAQQNTPNTTSTTTRLSLLAGAGIQTYLGEHGIATFEARALSIQVAPGAERTETQALFGIGYRWGQPKATPVLNTSFAPVAALPSSRVPEPTPTREIQTEYIPAPRHAAPVEEEVPRHYEPEITVVDATLPQKIVLDETVLHFTHGDERLTPAAERAVRDASARLKRYRGRYTLRIVGHTSPIGSRKFNRDLSLRRAKTLARALIASGIPANRITTRGAGSDEPIASNKTARGQSRNRRVEILIIIEGPSVATRRRSKPLVERNHHPRKKKKAHSVMGS